MFLCSSYVNALTRLPVLQQQWSLPSVTRGSLQEVLPHPWTPLGGKAVVTTLAIHNDPSIKHMYTKCTLHVDWSWVCGLGICSVCLLTTTDRYSELIESGLSFDCPQEHCLHFHGCGTSWALVEVRVHWGKQFTVTEQRPGGQTCKKCIYRLHIYAFVPIQEGRKSVSL